MWIHKVPPSKRSAKFWSANISWQHNMRQLCFLQSCFCSFNIFSFGFSTCSMMLNLRRGYDVLDKNTWHILLPFTKKKIHPRQKEVAVGYLCSKIMIIIINQNCTTNVPILTIRKYLWYHVACNRRTEIMVWIMVFMQDYEKRHES